MAQPVQAPLPSQTPTLPTHPDGSSHHHRRGLAACLLLLMVATTLTGYVLHSRLASPGTTTQSEACPAPGETAASSCQLPDSATATPEPSPSQAETQVDSVLRYHQPAMVLFYSPICRPCMMMEALVQMVRRDYEPAVTFIEVTSDNPANATLVERMGVGSIPASFFIAPSGESKRVIGLMKQQDLRAELAALAAAGQALPAPTSPAAP